MSKDRENELLKRIADLTSRIDQLNQWGRPEEANSKKDERQSLEVELAILGTVKRMTPKKKKRKRKKKE